MKHLALLLTLLAVWGPFLALPVVQASFTRETAKLQVITVSEATPIPTQSIEIVTPPLTLEATALLPQITPEIFETAPNAPPKSLNLRLDYEQLAEMHYGFLCHSNPWSSWDPHGLWDIRDEIGILGSGNFWYPLDPYNENGNPIVRGVTLATTGDDWGGISVQYQGNAGGLVVDAVRGGGDTVNEMRDDADARMQYYENDLGRSGLGAFVSANISDPILSITGGQGMMEGYYGNTSTGEELNGADRFERSALGFSQFTGGLTAYQRQLAVVPAARRAAIRSALSDMNGKLVTRAEREGIKYTIRRIESLGYELRGAIKYSGNQGIDLEFAGIKWNRGLYGLAEAKASPGLGSLKVDSLGIRQGSFDFFESRLLRAGRTDLWAELHAGNVQAFVGLEGSSKLYEVNLGVFRRNMSLKRIGGAVVLVLE